MGKKGSSVNPFGARTKSVTRYSLQVNQNKFVLKCTYCHNQCSQILNYDSNLFFLKEAHILQIVTIGTMLKLDLKGGAVKYPVSSSHTSTEMKVKWKDTLIMRTCNVSGVPYGAYTGRLNVYDLTTANQIFILPTQYSLLFQITPQNCNI